MLYILVALQESGDGDVVVPRTIKSLFKNYMILKLEISLAEYDCYMIFFKDNFTV